MAERADKEKLVHLLRERKLRAFLRHLYLLRCLREQTTCPEVAMEAGQQMGEMLRVMKEINTQRHLEAPPPPESPEHAKAMAEVYRSRATEVRASAEQFYRERVEPALLAGEGPSALSPAPDAPGAPDC